MEDSRKPWIFWTLCLVGIQITGVSADQTQTALIATGCVLGALIILAVFAAVVFYFRRIQHREDKKRLPRNYLGKSIANGVYRDHTGYRGAEVIPSMNFKAFTQHAVHPKYRPPVKFYTVKSDPRGSMMEPPNAVPLGPPHTYRGAPPVGRPVIFLDYAPQQSKNGGLQIHDMEPAEGRSSRHHHSRDSKDKKRAMSRSKSRSRSRDPDPRETWKSSDQDVVPVTAVPGDIILKKQDDDLSSYNRNSGLREDANNNPLELDDHVISQTIQSEEDHVPAGGVYSVTQVHTSESLILPEISLGPSNDISEEVTTTTIYNTIPVSTRIYGQMILQEREHTIPFGDEDDDDPEPTPRQDYNAETQPTSSFSQSVLRTSGQENIYGDIDLTQIFDDSSEPTPRPDYNTEFTLPTGELDDIIAIGQTTTTTTTTTDNNAQIVQHIQDEIETRQDLTYNFERSPSTLNHRQDPSLQHPPTPPAIEDMGVRDVVYPPRASQRRSPSPPPDMGGEHVLNDDTSPSDRLDHLARTNIHMSQRPPTPPAGLIRRDVDTSILASHIKSQHGSKETSSGGLPFLGELLKRQRPVAVDSDEEVDVRQHSAPEPGPSRGGGLAVNSTHEENEYSYSAFITNTDNERENRRKQSVVQFTASPPEIIPQDEEPESPLNSSLHAVIIDDHLAAPPQPPPPPPPPMF